jgi:predicted metalloprotease with PDZ domain
MVLCVISIFISAAGCNEKKSGIDESSSVDYRVSINDPSSGSVLVTMTLRQKDEKRITLLQKCNAVEFQILDIAAKDEDGTPLPCSRLSGGRLEAAMGKRGSAVITYTVRPGGMGRHGHQGNVSRDFAIFDGRVFLFPEKSGTFKKASVSFSCPQGWQVVSPFKKSGDFYDPSSYGNELSFLAVEKSLMAFGRFHRETRTICGVEMQVFTYERWERTYRHQISDKAFRLFAYFQHLFKIPIASPYVACFVPEAADGGSVYGAVWSNGQGYEMPVESPYKWELFAHRLAHVVNEYEPYGMDFKNLDDTWLFEGWATYIEIVASADSRIIDGTAAWERLYREYLNKTALDPEKYDIPIAKQYLVKDPTVIEYLHYTKAPLVALALDFRIRLMTRNEKNLNGFMTFLFKKYGGHRGKIDLAGDLAAYTGEDCASFLTMNVQAPGILVPCWKLVPAATASRGKPLGTIAAMPVYEDDLYRYLKIRGKSLEGIEQAKQQLIKDRLIDNEMKKEGIDLTADYGETFLSRLSDDSWDLLQEKKREVFRELLEQRFFKEKMEASRLPEVKLPLLEKWQTDVERSNKSQDMKNRFIDGIFLGTIRDIAIIKDQREIFHQSESLEVVVKWKKQDDCLALFELFDPLGKRTYRKEQKVKARWVYSWITLPSRKKNTTGVWTLTVKINGELDARESFLVLPDGRYPSKG